MEVIWFQVANENKILAEWKESTCSNLPALINAVEQVKATVNEFLTNLIAQEGSCERDKKKLISLTCSNDDTDDEDAAGDMLSKIVKEIKRVCDDSLSDGDEGENKHSNRAKRFRK